MEDDQLERYSRNIRVAEIGVAGQEKLLAASVFVVGAGGLGSPTLLYLAAAGVGRIGFSESDRVELSNLQRQLLHSTPRVGRPKAESAAETLRELNPDIALEPFAGRVDATNAERLVANYGLIVDCCDNFQTRLLVADACRRTGRALVSAAVSRWGGQLFSVVPGKSNPCYRCLLRGEPPEGSYPSPAEAGVIGPVAGTLGALAAAEAIKLLLGLDGTLATRLLDCDLLRLRFRLFDRARDPLCPCCGEGAIR